MSNSSKEPPAQPDEGAESKGGFLTASQQKALSQLTRLAVLSGDSGFYAGFRPRIKLLIYGPTGAGKTLLVSRLADSLGEPGKPYPTLCIDGGTWIIFGAKAEPTTLDVIRAFIRRHEKGILFIDELDKLVPKGEAAWVETWNVCITSEVLSVLDAGPRLATAGWSGEDIDRLKNNFLLIGGGAWMRAYSRSKEEGIAHGEAMRGDIGIPEELSARFNSRFIEVAPPDRIDFGRALTRLYLDIGIPVPKPSVMATITQAAVDAGVGMRFVEQHLTDLLLRYPALRRKPPTQAAVATVSKRTKVFAAIHIHATAHAYELMERFEPAIAMLQVQMRLHGAHFFAQKVEDIAALTGAKPLIAGSFDQACDNLLQGLRIRYAQNERERLALHEHLWESGQLVGLFLAACLQDELEYLGTHKLVGLFTSCHTRLGRLLAAWSFLGSVTTDDKV